MWLVRLAATGRVHRDQWVVFMFYDSRHFFMKTFHVRVPIILPVTHVGRCVIEVCVCASHNLQLDVQILNNHFAFQASAHIHQGNPLAA